MARKRLIAPQFFAHGELYDAEVSSGLPLRLAFAGLWCQADRRGVFAWRPRELKLAVLPYDPADMGAVLDALADAQFIRSYEANGKRYGFIPSLKAWQTFHKDERPSSDPAPPATLLAASSYSPPPPVAPPPQQEIFDESPAPEQPGADTVSAPGQHGANMPIAVAVTGTSAVAVTEEVTPPPPPTHVLTHEEQPNSAPNASTMRLVGSSDHRWAQLCSAASSGEVDAFEQLLAPCGRARRGAVNAVLDIASGHRKHRIVGKTGRVAGVAEVFQAAAEMAANGTHWHIKLFQAYVRNVVDRPPAAMTAEERDAYWAARAREEQQSARQKTEAEIAAHRENVNRAMDAFRAGYGSRRSGPTSIGDVIGAIA